MIDRTKEQSGKSTEAQGHRENTANQGARGDGHSPFTAPSISLPKGGGAIRGIDEKFQVNPATGSGAMTVPIATSPARQGFGPQLALSYDSGSGNGPFGLGWSLSSPRITRKTDKGLPTYQDGEESDVFILSGAEDLVPVLVEGGGELTRHSQSRTLDGAPYRVQRYRPRIEGLFARIERWTNQETGEIHWRSISRDNVTTLYGRTDESRIADADDPKRIFSWFICECYDDKGNAIVYRYKTEDSANVDRSQVHERNRTDLSRSSNRYLKRILYGNRTPRQPDEDLSSRMDWMFEVVFDYGENHLVQLAADEEGRHFVELTLAEQRLWPVRQDPISSYRAAFEVRTYRLCRRVLMFQHFPDELGTRDYLVRATHFGYSESPINTVMTSVVQSGYLRQDDGRFQERSLPAVEFEYSKAEIQSEIQKIDSDSLENLPVGLAGSQYQWLDLDGEGISGILTEQGGSWFYKANLGNARFAPLETVASIPSLAALNSGQQLIDLAGDGQLDLVSLGGPAPGFYERAYDGSWTNHRAFASVPSITPSDPNLRFVDLTGDGHADILVTEDQIFTWYPSLAEEGYGPGHRTPQSIDEETGPCLVFADATQSIYLADMSGDGLVDLVRIRNGMVCYWPNLGYGRFGAKITMDNPPWFDASDLFDQKRIRLGDVDGSGITDILYVQHDRVAVYFNQAGNGWADAQFIEHLPSVDNLSDLTVTDVLGNGTACLVWSSPLAGHVNRPMCYIDLMGGQKPHLIVGYRNNLGAETRVQYATSTKFYLEDKAAGRPWITGLPFPVHVVERVETYDHISRNRFVSRYSYHHGHFDGNEREFHGFGLVKQIDTEEFAALSQSDALPTGDNIDVASHVPPVLTCTWFHTGVYLDRWRISNFFAGLLDERDPGEYYREPGLSDDEAARLLLPDTVMPEGLTLDEEREACRALKGSMLRQEVYALDGSDREPQPYAVTEQNLTIRVLQRRAGNRHGVFFTHAREALSYHYERNPADPRISHALTLAVDDYGNVLQSAAIGYGRRQPDPALQPADQEKQAQALMTFAENSFTNSIEEDDQYRTPLPSETLSYELTGLSLASDQVRFSFAEMQEAAQAAARIEYHQTPTDGFQKRVLEHARTLYRRNDLTDALPLGELQSLALPGESYQLAFTPEHLDLVFGDRVTDTMLSGEGRYLHFDGDDNWWIPSGRIFLSPNQEDDAAQERAFARQHFFLPQRFRDPFGQTATVEYDTHDLLMARTTDPLENTVTARNDYRLLAPDLVTDPNGNRSAVAYDVLGRVAGAAVMGKVSETVGDSLEGFQAQPTQSQIDAFFADPRGPIAAELLGNATSRIIYDETRFQRLQQPPFAATMTRETHVSDLGEGKESPVRVSMAHSDGFGREIQRKIQAEPGVVPRRDEGGTIIVGPNLQPEMTANEVSPRWVGSGWTVFNNKGKPVRQYEPYFTDTHRFEFDARIGVSPVLFYDPAVRVVATLHPNHTWEKALFDPWRQESWDVNDTALIADPASDPDVGDFFRRLPNIDYLPTWHARRLSGELGSRERSAAEKTAVHANTPTVAHFDSLGRPFLTIGHNRFERGGVTVDESYPTRVELDIEGNQRAVRDALVQAGDPLGRIVMRYDYDLLGNQIHSASMEAGERWMLNNVAGQSIRARNNRGHVFRTEYDELRRPARSFVTGADARDPGREILFHRTVYGEGIGDAFNHRGRAFQIFDGAGVVTNEEYDFKGNLRRGLRQLLVNYKDAVDWSLDPVLETEFFTSSTTYDALNRPVVLTAPDNSRIHPVYNEANLLERVEVNLRGADAATTFVNDIDYDAKGQRELIEYGNGVRTTYEYDRLTFRLTRLMTLRGNEPLQGLTYTYDPSGNITDIRDDAQQTIYFNNQVVEPHADYTYDAIYRLIEASGREHIGQASQPPQTSWNDEFRVNLPHPHDGQAMRRYTEEYHYDGVGNFLQLIHQANGGSWTRAYAYEAASLIEPGKQSNRLSRTRVGGTNEPYAHDVHGNMIAMPHLPLMQWDFQDQLQASARQVVNEGTPETTWYVYDGAGQRVRKVTERQAATGHTPTRMNERIYLGDFEVYREYGVDGAATVLERQTLHIMDDKQRIALIETRTQGIDGSPAQLIRYHLANHLGSASLELDEVGQIISYEEYHPYGTTAYQAGRNMAEVSLKRYRYTGKERDEETGLNYHGARYYACWLGRWAAADPAGVEGGVNFYNYSVSNPVVFVDPTGSIPMPAKGELEKLAEGRFEAYLKEKEIPYRRQVPIDVEVDGTIVRGTADFVVETRPGVLEAVEFKGDAKSKWTPKQKLYIPALRKGAKFTIVGKGGEGPSKFADLFKAGKGGRGSGLIATWENVWEFAKQFSRITESVLLRRRGVTLTRVTQTKNRTTGDTTLTEEEIEDRLNKSARQKGLKVKKQGGFATVGSMAFLAVSVGGTLLLARADNLQKMIDVAKDVAFGLALDAALARVLGSVRSGFVAGALIEMAFMESDNPAYVREKEEGKLIQSFIEEEFGEIEDPEAYQIVYDKLKHALRDPTKLEKSPRRERNERLLRTLSHL